MNIFFSDFRKYVNEAPNAVKIIAQYERGLITLSEALKSIEQDNDNNNFYFMIQYKERKKGARWHYLTDTLYTYEEAQDEVFSRQNHEIYEFRAKKQVLKDLA